MKATTNRAVFEHYLKQINSTDSGREKRSILDLLFTDLLKINADDTAFNPAHHKLLTDALARLNNSEPVQYITNIAHFYGDPFYVTPSVLIPRMETEELAFESLKHLNEMELDRPVVIDIGTGSGCLAITLKKRRPNIHMIAMDVSADAILVTQENIRRHKVDIMLEEWDFLKTSTWPQATYDLIICNPPYIAREEISLMERQVIEYEPEIALFAPNNDPLFVYQRLVELAKTTLKKGGLLMAEINEFWGAKITTRLADELWCSSLIRKDMQGKDRILQVKKLR